MTAARTPEPMVLRSTPSAMSAAVTRGEEIVLGVGTYLGCRGYVVVLP